MNQQDIIWPPDYTSEFQKRQNRLRSIMDDPNVAFGALEYYKENAAEFIEHWCVTYDPRNAGSNLPTLMPFIMFPKQKELVQFLNDCLKDQESGLIEKTRDMGATWVCCAYSVWLWRFLPGASIGWGSRKETLVDKLGDPDSIFEKIRMLIYNLPRIFWPKGFKYKEHCSYMRIMNPDPESNATIIGESGDNIGRGGRKSLFFKDESAHYERAETIESALGDNTNVQIDISSVKGTASVFARKRAAGELWTPESTIEPGKTRILIMDWRDHPNKDQGWYDKRREKAEREGLLHVFAQEVDRDYAASIEGVLIDPKYVNAAIDAHLKLKLDIDGQKIAALDVADEGRDKHALSIRKGILLNWLMQWAYGDGGAATRETLATCTFNKVNLLNYDCIGVGAATKSEINRLKDEENVVIRYPIMQWNASNKVLKPNEHVVINEKGEQDKESPKNKDFYANLKAQGWGNLRLRFEKTYKAVHEGVRYDDSELIAIDSKLEYVHQLVKELSQPTVRYDGKGKMVIDKKPKGQASPNLADSVMMNYWPIFPKTLDFKALSIQNKSKWSG